VIYLDTSVALAHLLAEDRRPPDSLWSQALVSSRLLEYELWTRIHARALMATHGDLVRQLLGRLAVLELIGEVLERSREPFPAPVRTLDALHLASAEFLRAQGVDIALVSYDARLLAAAEAMSLPVHALS
jgi:predicted nucleic acid-binding protein